MADRKSLAEEAVEALAAVGRMDFDMSIDHEERHHVRSLKRVAEQALADAFRQARELAFLAEDIRKAAQKVRDAAAE